MSVQFAAEGSTWLQTALTVFTVAAFVLAAGAALGTLICAVARRFAAMRACLFLLLFAVPAALGVYVYSFGHGGCDPDPCPLQGMY